MRAGIPYKRGRFVAELAAECRYTVSHCWLREESTGVWRIGITQFAAWMLGDPVEFAFSVAAGARVDVGQEIGWVEGLKSVNTIHAAAAGEFLGAGGEVSADVTLIASDPQGRGWLYSVRGAPAQDSVDLGAYIKILDEEIDAVMRLRQAECEGDCAG
jgi:glycine cleavage system H protein